MHAIIHQDEMNMPAKSILERMGAAWSRHERSWKDNRYVYAVVSRRSRGVSIGINLNPDKACNFNCVYCQVRRGLPPTVRTVSLEKLADELHRILQAENEGSLYEDAPFNLLSSTERGVRDIAFSGDGEPTAFPRFEKAVRIAASARRRFGLDSAKLILLTNAGFLQRSAVRAGLAVLDDNNGEIWAKLDAGTEEYFHLVNRSRISLEKILDNILGAARARALAIQSLWLRIHGIPPRDEELEAYCECVNRMLSAGGRFKILQLYSIARDPAEAFASPLSDGELDHIASFIEARLPIPVEVFYSAGR
jgi:wyosine [tRNA(Phe)-imidazoG37] synthetase (radical SAM superfamily)